MKKIFYMLLLFLPLTGCMKKEHKITIAEVTHSPFYAPQYVAVSEGIFEKYNLDVEIILASGADKVMSTLLSKDAQIGLMGPEASIYVYNQGRSDYAINFAQLTQKDGSFLLGREKIEDFDLNMLNGSEIIAGREGGMPLMVLEYILKTNGLEIGKNDKNANINVRSDIQFSAMGGAFSSGEGDYVSLFEPNASNMEKEKKGYVVASLGELSGEIPYTCYSALDSFIKNNKADVSNFTKAIAEAQEWCYSHSSSEIATSIKDFFKENTIEELTTYVDSYKTIEAWAHNPMLTEKSFNKLQDIIIMSGQIEEYVPYEKLVLNN